MERSTEGYRMLRAPAWVHTFLISLLAISACSTPTSTAPPTSSEVSRPRRGVSSTGGGGKTQPPQPGQTEQPGANPSASDTIPGGTPTASNPVTADPVASTPVATDTVPGGNDTSTGTTPAEPPKEFRVVNPAGTPAVGVKVRFFPGDLGAPSAYRTRRLMSTAINEATTDFDGRIDLSTVADARYNIEAEQSPGAKAFRFNFAVKQESLTLVLQPTGSVSGSLKLPGQTDHGGIFVSLLGTPYKASTNATGVFSMLHVPPGAYHLYAERDGKFTYNVSQVVVKSNEETPVPEATLSSLTPILSGLSPASGGHGTTVTLTADNFLAGKTYTVKFGSGNAVAATRISDTTLTAVLPVISDTSVSVINVIVTVDGKDSNALTFTPIQSLSITPPDSSFTTGATRQYQAEALDMTGNPVASPVFMWETSGSAVSVSATGLVTANQAGTGTLSLKSGDLTSTPLILTVTNPITATTVAGTGTAGNANGSALASTFNEPTGVTVDAAGNIYVADYRNHLIRLISGGQVTTLAGQILNQVPSPVNPAVLLNEFRDGTGTNATFNYPYQVSVAGGSLLVGDSMNQRIRSVTITGGVVSTLAGTGTIGVLQGDWQDGDAIDVARFQGPTTARLAPDGSIYVADTLNHRIRRIDTNGQVSTVAGTGVEDYADGAALTEACFSSPNDLAIATDGTIYVADTNNHRIRRISNGQVSTLAGGEEPGRTDGTPAEASFSNPFGLALNASGTKLYVTDQTSHAIREIDLIANPIVVKTLCGGTEGFKDGTEPQFRSPHGIAIDPSGDLLVADFENHRIRRINLP